MEIYLSVLACILLTFITIIMAVFVLALIAELFSND